MLSVTGASPDGPGLTDPDATVRPPAVHCAGVTPEPPLPPPLEEHAAANNPRHTSIADHRFILPPPPPGDARVVAASRVYVWPGVVSSCGGHPPVEELFLCGSGRHRDRAVKRGLVLQDRDLDPGP